MLNRLFPERSGSILLRIFAVLVLLISANARLSPASADDPVDRLDPDLLRSFESSPDGTTRVIVQIKGPADLRVAAANPDVVSRRKAVAQTLQTRAASAQASILSDLGSRQGVKSVESLWSANAIILVATLPVIQTVARRADVQSVKMERTIRLPGETAVAAVDAPAIVQPNISQIHADQVWSGLGNNGDGAVIAIIDTGVDGNHPILRDNFRGRGQPASAQGASWFVATDESYATPVDNDGHGTHVAGIAVGSNGFGVAPGAKWIAAKIFNDKGLASSIAIHRAIEWVLAPGGDPALAPDAFNASWGSEDAADDTLLNELVAVRAAGIVPVFANGNSGPGFQTVYSPASLAPSFAVGAVDGDDVIALFSSRGPSPFGFTKPDVAAPGVSIISAKPGAAYQRLSGTSMAAPHVTGAIALLRSLHKHASVDRIEEVLEKAATPLGASIPNNAYGTGRIDVFRAALLLQGSASISGRVNSASGPIAGANVIATKTGTSDRVVAVTGVDGNYSLELLPGIYQISAKALGYVDKQIGEVDLPSHDISGKDIQLTAAASGVMNGRILQAGGGGISATITTADNSFTAVSDATTGAYRLALPPGSYDLRVTALGYKISRFHVDVAAGVDQVFDRTLVQIPRILIVDSGGWYNERRGSYYQTALNNLDMAADKIVITERFKVPSYETLINYDIVIWSSPLDSPGLAGAAAPVQRYLKVGGRMILSGQDLAYFEGGGSQNTGGFTYFHEELHSKFSKDDSGSFNVSGTGAFAGLQFTLNDVDSAKNQKTPDELAPADRQSSPAFVYSTGAVAGLAVDVCVPGRALVLGFGLEGVGPLDMRSKVLGRAIDWLVEQPGPVSLEVTVPTKPLVTSPGTKAVGRLNVWNTGLTTDTVTVDLSSSPWQWSEGYGGYSAPSGTTHLLGPCQVQDIDVWASPPWDAKLSDSQAISVTFRSSLDPTVRTTGVVTAQTTSPLLLVDDERWFQVEGNYDAAYQSAGIPHDMWPADTVGSPSVDLMNRYGAVVWFTGYDWFDPINPSDEGRLGKYLNNGGRLFLLSQGYLDYQHNSPFLSAYLGTVGPRFDITTTKVSGITTDPIGKGVPEETLNLPYPAYIEVVTPTASARVDIVNDSDLPLGVSAQGDSGWRSIFLSFGLEGLTAPTAQRIAKQSFAWLGSLVGTALRSDHEFLRQGDTFTLGLVVQNQSPSQIPVTASIKVPPGVALTAPNPDYDPGTRMLQVSTNVTATSASAIGYQFKLDPDSRAGSISFNATVVSGDERMDRQISLPLAGTIFIPAVGQKIGSDW